MYATDVNAAMIFRAIERGPEFEMPAGVARRLADAGWVFKDDRETVAGVRALLEPLQLNWDGDEDSLNAAAAGLLDGAGLVRP